MRQATVKGKSKRHGILLLLLVLMIIAGSLFLFPRQVKEHEEQVLPTMFEVLTVQVTAAGNNMENYSLIIEENGPGYKLNFQGQVNGEKIYGKLEDYELELFSAYEQYFVKSATENEWQDLGVLGLEDLPDLIRTPRQLLDKIWAEKEISVAAGEKRIVNDALCQVYSLEIQKPHARFLSGLPQNAVLEKLQVYLWLDEENLFIHRLALILDMVAGGEKVQLNRLLQMEPQAKALPAGLPPVEIPGIIV
ncbi:MAG: hypothetical protein GX357_01065 [Firmicutes bacterium]|nr:hypothetical protein [Bacillota bacterium]